MLNTVPRKGLFGGAGLPVRNPWDTPGYGDGFNQRMADMAQKTDAWPAPTDARDGVFSDGGAPVPSRPNHWTVAPDGGAMSVEGVPTRTRRRRGLFGGGKARAALGVIGDAMQVFGGGQATYAQRQMELADQQRQEAIQRQQRAWQLEDRDHKANLPDYFMSGRDRVRFNPATGESQVVFDAPEEFEAYARTMGLEPGTDDYYNAVEDYVLRGHGPTALGYDKQLDDYRTANDRRLDDHRTDNRIKVRGVPTWLQANPRPKDAAPRKARPTATGANGAKVEWDGKAWVPVR
jgi:hypothetical protein